jgi:predicted hydrocarbon binding protein
MPTPIQLDSTILGIGRKGLHALRRGFLTPPADPAMSLQEAGYAAGEEMYGSFRHWLPGYSGVNDPADLDATALGPVLSEFFRSVGWGSVTLERLGQAGLTIDSPDWAEAEADANSAAPACHFTAGLMASFLERLAGSPFAVMEVECRSCSDARCRFLAGSPETLQSVYDSMSTGKDYRQALLE